MNKLYPILSKHILAEVSHPHPESLSIDHIMPLSLGGKHIRANVQLTHLICNLKKGNRIEKRTRNTPPIYISR